MISVIVGLTALRKLLVSLDPKSISYIIAYFRGSANCTTVIVFSSKSQALKSSAYEVLLKYWNFFFSSQLFEIIFLFCIIIVQPQLQLLWWCFYRWPQWKQSVTSVLDWKAIVSIVVNFSLFLTSEFTPRWPEFRSPF